MMKKTNKIFVYAICILLSALIASATVMVGAADDPASTESISTTASKVYTTVPSTKVVTTTEKDITDIISEVVSKNELQDDFSEVGDDIKDFTGKSQTFLEELKEAFEKAFEKFIAFFTQMFKLGTFD